MLRPLHWPTRLDCTPTVLSNFAVRDIILAALEVFKPQKPVDAENQPLNHLKDRLLNIYQHVTVPFSLVPGPSKEEKWLKSQDTVNRVIDLAWGVGWGEGTNSQN